MRYLVVDTGPWLVERQVLITPHAFGHFDTEREVLHVNLTKEQVTNSPSLHSPRPVSRQYEEEYYGYYGWPAYWQGGSVWGTSDLPVVPSPEAVEGTANPHHGHNQRDDVHLRSGQAITGYEIQATDGGLGAVASFGVNRTSWLMTELVIETGRWLAGRHVLIRPDHLRTISYEESKVYVELSKAGILQAAEQAACYAGAGERTAQE